MSLYAMLCVEARCGPEVRLALPDGQNEVAPGERLDDAETDEDREGQREFEGCEHGVLPAVVTPCDMQEFTTVLPLLYTI